MAEKRLLQELNSLNRAGPSKTNPQIIELAPIDSNESLLEWHAVIAKQTKEDSPYYYNGQWNLLISVGRDYPMKPPSIRFDSSTPIHHPNINLNTGEICLDILKSDAWSPAWNLVNLVGAVLLLLDDPEPDSPLNIDSANLFRYDKVAFESIIQFTMWKYGTFCDSRAKDHSGIKLVKGVSLEDSYVFVNPFAQPEQAHKVEESSINIEVASNSKENSEVVLEEETTSQPQEEEEEEEEDKEQVVIPKVNIQQPEQEHFEENEADDVALGDTTIDTSTDVSSALSSTTDQVSDLNTTKDSKMKRTTSIKKSLSSALRRDKKKKSKSKSKTKS